MNRNYKTSSLTESAMITGILVVIAYLSSFISILMFFYPTPAIILAKRKGIKYAALALLASDIIISMLLGIQTGMTFLILYTPLSIALSYGIYKDMDANKTMLLGSAAYMISFVAMIFLMDAFLGINFVQQLKDIYVESFKASRDMLSNMPSGMNNEGVNEMIRTLDELGPMMVSTISNVFPAILIVSSVATAYVNYMVAFKFAKRFSISVKQHEGIAYFSFPKTFMVAMAAMMLLSYLLGALNISAGIIQANLFMILFAAMFLQGFGVVKFFLSRSQISTGLKRLSLFMILFIALFTNAGLSQGIALVGLVDLAIDLRKINKAI
ncbi:MAG: DUF2232 domain-containing protein [Sedimentibacter sp.]